MHKLELQISTVKCFKLSRSWLELCPNFPQVHPSYTVLETPFLRRQWLSRKRRHRCRRRRRRCRRRSIVDVDVATGIFVDDEICPSHSDLFEKRFLHLTATNDIDVDDDDDSDNDDVGWTKSLINDLKEGGQTG